MTVSEHEPTWTEQIQSETEGFDNQLSNLNRAVALERVGGDLELLREIAGLFLEHSPAMILDMRAALKAGDSKALEHAAHSFKGSVGNFGAESCHSAAYHVEALARSGDLAGAASAFNELEREIAILTPALTALTDEVAFN